MRRRLFPSLTAKLHSVCSHHPHPPPPPPPPLHRYSVPPQTFHISNTADQYSSDIDFNPPRRRCFVGRGSERGYNFAPDVERIYRILLHFHSRVPKLELALQDSGIILRPGLTERVLGRCGDAGNLGYRFFKWASKQEGYEHSRDVYKAMVKVLRKMRQFGAVWALIDEMRRDDPQLVTQEVFLVLIKRFTAAKMLSRAVAVLDEMPKSGSESPDEYVFQCLFDALCKNGDVKEAASLFDDMRMRFAPTLKQFESLLCAWCKEGKLMEAKHVLVQMKDYGFAPDVLIYNTLLSGYSAVGKMMEASELLREMKEQGCEPNAVSYGTLIQALCGRREIDEAMGYFAEMERCGCDGDSGTYTSLISGFCSGGDITRGYEILKLMIQKGIAPNEMTYMSIMAAHEKTDQLEECMELLKEMKITGYSPDLSIYTTVMRLACKMRSTEVAVRLWNEMEASRLSPTVDMYVILIQGLQEQGYLVEACKSFKEMVESGLLSERKYGIMKDLLNALLRAKKLELAEDIWSCIMANGYALNVPAWTIWIHALFSKRYMKEACSYCFEMVDADVMLQPDTFAKLMRRVKKLYSYEMAAEITERVRKMATDRKVSFKMYKRRGVRLRGKPEKKMDDRKIKAQK